MDAKPDVDQKAAFAAVQVEARRCRALLEAIAGPNERIVARTQADDPVWRRVTDERYNGVCAARGSQPRGTDPWLDAIRDDPDLRVVCDTRWELGEAVDVLRDRLGRLDSIAEPYDDLERCIRQAVTGSDRSPAELAGGVGQALDLARKAAAWKPTGGATTFDRWMTYLKNNPVIAAILIAAAAVTGAAAVYKAVHDTFAPSPPASQPASHGGRAG